MCETLLKTKVVSVNSAIVLNFTYLYILHIPYVPLPREVYERCCKF